MIAVDINAMKKKVLITGASGFVGSFLVEEAMKQGYEVYAGIRPSSSKKYLQHPDIRFFTTDFNDTHTLKVSLKDHYFHYIIQNAGITKASDKEEFYKVNAYAVRDFAQALIDLDQIPEKFIFISSLAAFGPADFSPHGIVNNDSTPHPVTTYGKSKLLGEQLLMNFSEFPYHIVRPTAVYGPREQDLLTVYKTINKGWEFLIGYKTQTLTFVYVLDLVRAIIMLLPIDKTRTSYFITDGQSYSAEDFNNTIKMALQVKAKKVRIPVNVLQFIAFLSEKLSVISGKYPALNLDKVNELKSISWQCDISHIRNDIRYQASYSLEEGMKETIQWLREHNEL